MRHVLIILTFFSLVHAASAEVPEQLHYNGYLSNAIGEAVDCPDALQCITIYDLTFRLYEASEGGVLLWEETHSAVPFYEGSFHALLGNAEPISAAILNGPTWLAIKVNENPEMMPRQKVVSAAFALRAGQADQAIEATNASQLGGVDAADYATQSGVDQLQSSLAPVATEGLPPDLSDGDDDTLGNMPCAPGMVAKATAAGWVCDLDEIGDIVDTTLSEAEVDAMVSNNGFVLADDIASLQAELTAALATISNLQTNLVALTSTVSGQGSNITALQSSLTNLQNVLLAAHADISSLQDSMSSAQADLATLQGAMLSAQNDITNLSGSLSTAQSDITNLQSVDVVLQTAISGLDASLAPIAKTGSYTELIEVPSDLADGDDDSLGALLCADGELAKRSGAGWVCAVDLSSVIEMSSSGLCDASATGHMYFDIALSALFVCNGTEYKQINACTGTCALPSTTACGLAVEDDCGNACGTVGTGLNLSQCTDPATVVCGGPIYDTCSNLCPTTGTLLEASQCYGLDSITPCGVTVVDPCGNPCGNTGTACDVGLVCQAGACTVMPDGFAEFTVIGAHAFAVPEGVSFMNALAIGGGANGQASGGGSAGGGGGGAKSILAVTPGQTIILVVGRGGSLQDVFQLNGGDSTVGAPFNLVAGGGNSNGGGGIGTGGNHHNTKGGTSSPGSSHSNAVKIDGLPEEAGDGGGAGAWLNGFGGVATAGNGLGYGGGGGAQCCNHYGGNCLGGNGGANGFAGGGWGQPGGGPGGGQSGSTNGCNTYFHGGGGGSYGGGGGNDGQGVDSSCLNQFLGGDGAHGYVRFEWGPSIIVE